MAFLRHIKIQPVKGIDKMQNEKSKQFCSELVRKFQMTQGKTSIVPSGPDNGICSHPDILVISKVSKDYPIRHAALLSNKELDAASIFLEHNGVDFQPIIEEIYENLPYNAKRVGLSVNYKSESNHMQIQRMLINEDIGELIKGTNLILQKETLGEIPVIYAEIKIANNLSGTKYEAELMKMLAESIYGGIISALDKNVMGFSIVH